MAHKGSIESRKNAKRLGKDVKKLSLVSLPSRPFSFFFALNIFPSRDTQSERLEQATRKGVDTHILATTDRQVKPRKKALFIPHSFNFMPSLCSHLFQL